MLIFPEPRRVSDSGSCVSYADRRWLVLPAEAGFELKEAAMCAAELLSERFFSPVEVTAGTPGAGARLRPCTFSTPSRMPYYLPLQALH